MYEENTILSVRTTDGTRRIFPNGEIVGIYDGYVMVSVVEESKASQVDGLSVTTEQVTTWSLPLNQISEIHTGAIEEDTEDRNSDFFHTIDASGVIGADGRIAA